MQPFGQNRHGLKIGGCVPWGVELGPHLSVAWAEAYHRTKWHLDTSNHLATTDIGRKLGGAVPPFLWGELGPHLAQCGLPAYQVAS